MLVCTLGDPFSINTELVASSLSKIRSSHEFAVPIVLVGSYQQWNFQSMQLGLVGRLPAFEQIQQLSQAKGPGFFFLDVGGRWQDPREYSQLESGEIAVNSLKVLQGFDPDGKLAVLTCPIDKLACSIAGFKYIGQTEYFESLWDGQAVMTLAGDRLKVGLATNHLPLSQVAASLNSSLICQKILKLGKTLQDYFGIEKPKLGVCGLNPHCGEGGLVGREDIEIIEPAIQDAKSLCSYMIHGPLPADTVFWRSWQGEFDGVLAMYHDQGLGPLKTLHFDSAINISGGLKHLRVSPDHGPARDLVFKGQASSRSFAIAWQTCMQYLKG